MGKKRLLQCVLFFGLALTSLTAEERLSEFRTDNLAFYYLGWSEDSKLAFVEESRIVGHGPAFRLVVTDSVTDETVYEFGPAAAQTYRHFTLENRTRFTQAVVGQKIQESRPVVESAASFRRDGVDYSIRMTPLSFADGSDGIRSLELALQSSRGDSKTIFRYNDAEDGTRLMNFELKGVLVSPYEPRVVFVGVETLDRNGTFQRYRLIGAHLLNGFSRERARGNLLINTVINGQLYVCRMLLDYGHDVNSADSRGYSALLLAARNGKWEIAELLTRRGADPSVTDDRGRTALHYAAEAGEASLCRLLKEAGSPLTTKDNMGLTPSAAAAAAGYRDLAQLLRD